MQTTCIEQEPTFFMNEDIVLWNSIKIFSSVQFVYAFILQLMYEEQLHTHCDKNNRTS